MKTTDEFSKKVSEIRNTKSGKRRKLDIDMFLINIVDLMTRHNQKELTYSRISQLLKIPRSTLYYYFGNTTQNMFDEAIKFAIKIFTQLFSINTHDKLTDWNTFQQDHLMNVVRMVRQYPWIPHLYFRYRKDITLWGDSIRNIENTYCINLSTAWEQFHNSPPDQRSIRLACYIKLGFLWGFTTDQSIWSAEYEDKLALPLVKHFSDITTGILQLKFGDTTRSASGTFLD